MRRFWQMCACPSRHWWQCPQLTCISALTKSPCLTARTSSPTCSTVPQNSCPSGTIHICANPSRKSKPSSPAPVRRSAQSKAPRPYPSASPSPPASSAKPSSSPPSTSSLAHRTIPDASTPLYHPCHQPIPSFRTERTDAFYLRLLLQTVGPCSEESLFAFQVLRLYFTCSTTPIFSNAFKYSTANSNGTGPYSADTPSRISCAFRFPSAKFSASYAYSSPLPHNPS